MRLWLRLALLMAMVAIVPLSLATARSIQVSVRSAQRGAQEGLERDAHLLSSMVGGWLDGQARAFQGWLSLYPDLDQRPASQQESLLQAIFVATPGVNALLLVDEEGGEVVPPVALAGAVSGGTLAGRARSSTESLRALHERLPFSEIHARWDEDREAAGEGATTASRAAHWSIGPAYVPHDRRGMVVPLAVAGSGSRLILGVELDLARILDELLLGAPGPERSVSVFTREGVLIWATDGAVVDATRLRMLLGTRASFADDVLGLYGGIAPIGGSEWTLVVTEPASISERTAVLLRRQTLSVLAVSIILAILFGVIVSRGVSEPVGSLRDAALAVADGDYDRRVRVDSSDEIGQLASAFNHMADRLVSNRERLRAQQHEIEAFNAELQARVDARTAELRAAQTQLVQSGQLAAVAELGAGLAHELNNPLTGVLGLAQVLRSKYPDERLLSGLESEAERCRGVVGRLLRLSAEDVDPSPGGVVDLGACVDEVMGLVQSPFRQRGVILAFSTPERAVQVQVEPSVCVRVLAQVLTSLRAGLPAGARVDLAVSGVDGAGVVHILPTPAVALGDARDDFLAGALSLWVARRTLDEIGGHLADPDASGAWRVVLPAPSVEVA